MISVVLVQHYRRITREKARALAQQHDNVAKAIEHRRRQTPMNLRARI